MPLNPRRVRLVVGCLGVALLAAIPALSSRTVAPAANRDTPAPAATPVEAAPVATAPVELVVAPVPVAAQVPPMARKVESPAAVQPSGMMAYLDEFGNFVQSPPEPLPTEGYSIPQARTPDTQLKQTDLGRGRGVMVELDDTFHEFAIVRRDASGKLHFDCLQAADAAKTMTIQPASPAALPEE